MLIWRLHTKKIGERSLDLPCNTCKTKNLFISCFQRIFSLYWIPTLPLKKENSISCAHCGTIFPCEMYSNYLSQNEKSFNTPWWYYAGLIIIIMIVVAGILNGIFPE